MRPITTLPDARDMITATGSRLPDRLAGKPGYGEDEQSNIKLAFERILNCLPLIDNKMKNPSLMQRPDRYPDPHRYPRAGGRRSRLPRDQNRSTGSIAIKEPDQIILKVISAILIGSVAVISGPARAAPDQGAALYAAQCSTCHQANGVGVSGSYPPLQGRIDRIAASAEGRHYLADVLVYGMLGRIEAGGTSYYGLMPPFKRLSDADIASVLSWLSALGDSKPPPVIVAADIAGVRDKPLSLAGAVSERKALAALHPLP